ncbi:unnamed protein product, partial [marine sediment metagenome]
LETDAAALPDERQDDKDGEPAPDEEEYARTDRQLGRPWFGLENEATDAAAEPAEELARAPVVTDDEDMAEELEAPGGEWPAAVDTHFAYRREGGGEDQPSRSLADVPAEGDSDGAGVATTGVEFDAVKNADKLAKTRQPAPPQAVQLQRLVIVLQQVPAEQLPARANPRRENAEMWRRASRTTGE